MSSRININHLDKPRTVIQGFTGGFFNAQYTAEAEEAFLSYSDRVNADIAIIGWNTGFSYERIIRELHRQGREIYLWLPVFSEYGDARITALDYLGNKHQSVFDNVIEDFTFACPGKVHNIELAYNYYEKYFRTYGFDGVFLDKIRFSSFGNGFSSGLGCFCEECCSFYSQNGVDMAEFRSMMRADDKGFLIPSEREGMLYHFADSVIESLFLARAKLITSAVSLLTCKFRAKGLKVGYDVFAPPLAYLFGQDIKALAGMADFIKPMIYRVTDAPAGIPFETKHLKIQLNSYGCMITDELEILWQTADLAGTDCFEDQLLLLKEVDCDIYCGVEVNKDSICATNSDYVNNSLAAVRKAGLAGWVLSWDVLSETVFP